MTIIDLIKQIKPFPILFIRKHSIFNLEVFIDGWYYRDENEDVKADILYTDFYEWLRKRYNMNDSRGWADILLYIFKTEEEALIGNVSDVLLKAQQPTKQYNVKR